MPLSDSVHGTHCEACIRKAACSESSCPWKGCPNECGASFHACKEQGHLVLCPLQEVGCVSAVYGCTARMRRAEVKNHLAHCPASAVVCSFSWQRREDCSDLSSGMVVPVVSGAEKETPAYHLDLLEADTELSQSHCDWEGGLDVQVYGRMSGSSRLRFGSRVSSQDHPRLHRVEAEKDQYMEHSFRRPLGKEEETRFTFWCSSVVRRDEVEYHYQWHEALHLGLDGSWQVHHCPLRTYGCQFAVERFSPLPLGSKVKLDSLHQSFTVDPVEVLDASAAEQEGGSSYLAELQKRKELALFGYYCGESMDPLSQLPSEVLVLVLQHLDSLSLLQLSQVSTHFRRLCSSLVRQRGVVEIGWQRVQRPEMYCRWREANRKVCCVGCANQVCCVGCANQVCCKPSSGA